MPVNKKEILALSDKEKLTLVGEIWDSMEESSGNPDTEELKFAEQRLQMHEDDPSDNISWEELREKLRQKHGL